MRACCAIRTRKQAVRQLVTGLSLLMLLGAIVPVSLWGHRQWKKKIDSGVRVGTKLDDPTSPTFQKWLDNSQNPLTLRAYVFNVLNPLEVLNGEKLAVQEIGPFVYRDYQRKVNVSFNGNHTEVNFQLFEHFQFDRAASVADDSMLVRTLNVVFAGLAGSLYGTLAGNLKLFVGYNTYSEVDRMFSAHSVRDLLFGYWDPVLALFSSGDPNVSPFFPGLVKNMTSLANVTGLNTLTTGRDETLPYRGYMRFRGATINTVCRTLPPPCAPTDRVPIWQTLSLSRVQGLDGSQLHPDVSAGESFSFWNAGAMRALRYVNRADGPEPQRTSFKGIATLRFTMDPHEMLNATLFAANAGYYQNEFTGFFNLTRFASLARLFVSKPHFAGVPPPIGTSVVGMSPQLDLHDSFIDVEPITGATMHLLQRSQVNFQMGTMSNMPNASSGQFDGVWFPRLRRPLMMPVVWIEEEGGIDDADAGNFRTQVYGAEFIYELILWGGVALACLCFLVGAPLSVRAALHLWRFRPQLTYSKRPGDDDAAAEVERASLVRGDAAAAAAGLADAPASDASPASYGATDASYKEPVDISYDR